MEIEIKKKLLGSRIQQARKDIGMTGERLAEKCNISPTYLRQLESGIKLPSLPMLVSLCNSLNVSPNYLLADNVDATDVKIQRDIVELFDSATPKQQELIISMIKCALKCLND